MNAVPGSAAVAEAPPCIAFISASFDMRDLAERLRSLRPEWRIRVWPEPGFEDAQVAVCWDAPSGVYARMPKLALIHGIAAGVDNIVDGQDLRGIPVCRVVDAEQVQGLVEYVLWGVLHFHRAFDQVLAQQAARTWRKPALRKASECRVGIMGLGEMGAAVARDLLARGYDVRGFNRSPKAIDGLAGFWGGAEVLPAFLCELDILVCLLPLTPETRGLLDGRLFECLPRGAALVHAGRGAQLVPEAMCTALRSGHLRGAIVDVFPVEPLPGNDPLWCAPGLLVTPHMATMAKPGNVVRQVAMNIERLREGSPVRHRTH